MMLGIVLGMEGDMSHGRYLLSEPEDITALMAACHLWEKLDLYRMAVDID